MTDYLVTGGAGFIGSNLVAELVQRGERVRVLDNFSTGRRENLAPVRDAVELIEGDLRHPAAVARAVQGVDCVFHLGALASVPSSIEDPLATHAVNATGTLNLLVAAEAAGVRRLIFSSSCAVYGDSPALPKTESMIPAPQSPYAASKLAGEHYCQTFSEAFDLRTVCLRYFNVFGPRQDPGSQYAAVIPSFLTAMLGGRRPTIYGDGKQSRDFVYVANVVQANMLAANVLAADPQEASRPAARQVLNIASGQRHTLLELVAVLNDLLGSDIAPVHAPPRPGDIRHSGADIAAARESLGYHPRVSFRQGLRSTLAWYRDRS